MRRNNEQTEKVFTTLDAYLSGYLALKGFIPKLINQGDKVVFSFDASDELYKAIAEYNSGAMVEAIRFALVVEDLKSQVFLLKDKTGLWDWD